MGEKLCRPRGVPPRRGPGREPRCVPGLTRRACYGRRLAAGIEDGARTGVSDGGVDIRDSPEFADPQEGGC